MFGEASCVPSLFGFGLLFYFISTGAIALGHEGRSKIIEDFKFDYYANIKVRNSNSELEITC